MELPITFDKLQTMVTTAREQREEEFQELILKNLTPPMEVLRKLQNEITESVFKQYRMTCFRITAGVFPYIYKRFGDTKQVEKELWVVLADYLKNFPSANRILETTDDARGNPTTCTLVLCFNLPWTPPTSNQMNSHSPPM